MERKKISIEVAKQLAKNLKMVGNGSTTHAFETLCLSKGVRQKVIDYVLDNRAMLEHQTNKAIARLRTECTKEEFELCKKVIRRANAWHTVAELLSKVSEKATAYCYGKKHKHLRAMNVVGTLDDFWMLDVISYQRKIRLQYSKVLGIAILTMASIGFIELLVLANDFLNYLGK